MSYSGYDYLALKAFSKKSVIYAVGPQVGTGKESDVFTCTGDDDTGKTLILKIHRSIEGFWCETDSRLGRISFRTVKQNRDYLRGRKSASWMYLSRLAAEKEFQFMKVCSPRCFMLTIGPTREWFPSPTTYRTKSTSSRNGIH